MALIDALVAYQVVGLDANVFIYAYQAHPQFTSVVSPILARLDTDPDFRVVTSIVTLIEVTVHPTRVGDQTLLASYTDVLLNRPKIVSLPVDATIARKAAELRARYNLRTPDALQVATAIVAGAQAFITNDVKLKAVMELPILIVAEFVP